MTKLPGAIAGARIVGERFVRFRRRQAGNYIQVDLYLSFVMTMLLAFGIALEVPLPIVMLNLAGILTHERFRK
jgi:Sec-independent protein secretion pathway component TatC